MFLRSRRQGLRKPSSASNAKHNHTFLAFAFLTFLVGAINIQFHHQLHDEHVVEASRRQFQRHFKTSRQEAETDEPVRRRTSGNGSSVATSQAEGAGEKTSGTNEVNHLLETPQAAGTNASSTSTTSSFVRHPHVVIVTKIHGDHQWSLLEQSMCLLHYAYNHKVLYDIVVFSTDPVLPAGIASLRAVVAPASLSVVIDNKGLHAEYAAQPPDKQMAFLKRCNVTTPADLTWFSNCEGSRLAYNWQAEFRGLHLWRHPALADYRTMVWLDSDSFVTKPWEKDPVDYFIKNDGAIMFDHFPQGSAKFTIQKRLVAGFNVSVCDLKLSDATGQLLSQIGVAGECMKRALPNIHGFFHITNLDFYRSQPVQDGLKAIYADSFLERNPDDQLAVTAPAAILAPERSWEMRARGFRLEVHHNCMVDGLERVRPGSFITYWKEAGQFAAHPAAAQACKVIHGN